MLTALFVHYMLLNIHITEVTWDLWWRKGHVASRLKNRPHFASRLKNRPHVASRLKNRPHVVIRLKNRPHVFIRLKNRPHVAGRLKNRPHVVSRLKNRPHFPSPCHLYKQYLHTVKKSVNLTNLNKYLGMWLNGTFLFKIKLFYVRNSCKYFFKFVILLTVWSTGSKIHT